MDERKKTDTVIDKEHQEEEEKNDWNGHQHILQWSCVSFRGPHS